MKHYDIAIFGATMLAAGIIQSLSEEKRKDCIVIESSFNYASDYVPSMKTARIENTGKEPLCDRATELLSSLRERGIVDGEGNLHVFPLSAVCASLLSDCPVILGTSVTSVEKDSNTVGRVIKYINSEGFGSVCAKKVIDTTNLGVLRSNEGLRLTEKSGAKKYLCASLAKCSENAKDICGFSADGVSAVKGAIEDEYILKLKVKENSGYAAARELLAAKWASLSENEFYGWKIGAVAAMFEYDYASPVRISKNLCEFIPSTSYANPVDSFEGGLLCF